VLTYPATIPLSPQDRQQELIPWQVALGVLAAIAAVLLILSHQRWHRAGVVLLGHQDADGLVDDAAGDHRLSELALRLGLADLSQAIVSAATHWAANASACARGDPTNAVGASEYRFNAPRLSPSTIRGSDNELTTTRTRGHGPSAHPQPHFTSS
jgi:hypothetical protein